jgi:hypothetical protein
MTQFLKDGTGANKDGEGVKRTCKILGIKHTYKAIQTYLCGGTELCLQGNRLTRVSV